MHWRGRSILTESGSHANNIYCATYIVHSTLSDSNHFRCPLSHLQEQVSLHKSKSKSEGGCTRIPPTPSIPMPLLLKPVDTSIKQAVLRSHLSLVSCVGELLLHPVFSVNIYSFP